MTKHRHIEETSEPVEPAVETPTVGEPVVEYVPALVGHHKTIHSTTLGLIQLPLLVIDSPTLSVEMARKINASMIAAFDPNKYKTEAEVRVAWADAEIKSRFLSDEEQAQKDYEEACWLLCQELAAKGKLTLLHKAGKLPSIVGPGESAEYNRGILAQVISEARDAFPKGIARHTSAILGDREAKRLDKLAASEAKAKKSDSTTTNVVSTNIDLSSVEDE